jgi:histone H3/H4
MSTINKPTIRRLARKAGIKSISDEAYAPINNIIYQRLDDVLKIALRLNTNRGVKTLMVDDISNALSSLSENITLSTELGTKHAGC